MLSDRHFALTRKWHIDKFAISFQDRPALPILIKPRERLRLIMPMMPSMNCDKL